MKKISITLIVILLFLNSHAQSIDMPLDTIKVILCSQWQEEYIPGKKQIKFGKDGNYNTVFSLGKNKLVTQVKVAKGTPPIFIIFNPLN